MLSVNQLAIHASQVPGITHTLGLGLLPASAWHPLRVVAESRAYSRETLPDSANLEFLHLADLWRRDEVPA